MNIMLGVGLLMSDKLYADLPILYFKFRQEKWRLHTNTNCHFLSRLISLNQQKIPKHTHTHTHTHTHV
jgi:hypothetical protein